MSCIETVGDPTLGKWLLSIDQIVRDVTYSYVYSAALLLTLLMFSQLSLPGTHDILEIEQMWSNDQQMIEH